VTYLTIKKRLAAETVQGGFNANGKAEVGKGGLHPISKLNNTVLLPELGYRMRFIVFTSETQYGISHFVEVPAFSAASSVNATSSILIGVIVAILCIAFILMAVACIRKRGEEKNDYAQAMEVQAAASQGFSSEGAPISNPSYFTGDQLKVVKGRSTVADTYLDVTATGRGADPYLDVSNSNNAEYGMAAPALPVKTTSGGASNPSYFMQLTSDEEDYSESVGTKKQDAGVYNAGYHVVTQKGTDNSYASLDFKPSTTDYDNVLNMQAAPQSVEFAIPFENTPASEEPSYSLASSSAAPAVENNETPALPTKTTGAYATSAPAATDYATAPVATVAPVNSPAYLDCSDGPALPTKTTGPNSTTSAYNIAGGDASIDPYAAEESMAVSPADIASGYIANISTDSTYNTATAVADDAPPLPLKEREM
jgi:hypothetical protein